MAMRVCLVPVPHDIVRLYCRAIASESDAEFDDVAGQLRERGAQNQMLLRASTWAGSRLSLAAFEKAGRASEYYAWTVQRPYLITADAPKAAADQVTAARRVRGEREAAEFFEAQLLSLGPDLLDPPFGDAGEPLSDDPVERTHRSVLHLREKMLREREDRWIRLLPEIRKVRAMRRAILGGAAFDTDRRKWDVIAGMDVLTEELEGVTIEGPKLVRQYGADAAFVLAFVAVYCEPVWWLGRNFWPSLLLLQSWSLPKYLRRRRYRHVVESILSPATLPAAILQDIAVDGFERGMPRVCEGYATGLHFPATAIPDLLASLRSQRDGWIRLSRDATDYEDHEVRALLAILEEALEWAVANHVGLMEADEVSAFR
jgi:hypothetical protein